MLTATIDMPMPESCHYCPFATWHYTECECMLTKKHFEDNNNLCYRRPKFCPLKEKKNEI